MDGEAIFLDCTTSRRLTEVGLGSVTRLSGSFFRWIWQCEIVLELFIGSSFYNSLSIILGFLVVVLGWVGETVFGSF